MKINPKILSIPPYISTSWDNVVTIQMEMGSLAIHLKNGHKVSIPNLPKETIEEIFQAHGESIESSQKKVSMNEPHGSLSIGISPAELGMDGVSFTGMTQHDPSQKDSPDLPPELLSKIQEIAKVLGLGESSFMIPEGEPHCNCPFCQIAKAMHSHEISHVASPAIEEEIPDTELKFRDWEIKQIGENLYDVTSPLNASEHYQVFLGKPIGCTCGNNNCEHIVAVLNS